MTFNPQKCAEFLAYYRIVSEPRQNELDGEMRSWIDQIAAIKPHTRSVLVEDYSACEGLLKRLVWLGESVKLAIGYTGYTNLGFEFANLLEDVQKHLES